ncbi:50S ribosomal protein L6 [Marivibrio halodurans]|uniref:Large ribosomal subunit protein uL6 n=1 Tax=Marivibrio halodurans TaxID=2039722 RepID=A0A8J7V2A8_9PROT|nr:50S ribosomal protein L6 [Marivibrio halodurans]MBP5857160.1 50S ribosomal protein L6 [Marivibrio halodurans]
MSRVGINPVTIPSGVEVSLAEGLLTAKGKNGEQFVRILDFVDVNIADEKVTVTPQNMTKRARQAWGTTRALINNAIKGASEGFTRRLEVNGVGYRAMVQGTTLKLSLGLSHDVNYPIPSDVKIAIEGDRGNVIAVSGASKQRVGQIASEIRAFRPPEPYKGKGVKYAEEQILRKEGKKK